MFRFPVLSLAAAQFSDEKAGRLARSGGEN
jgi:hypothetical protein